MSNCTLKFEDNSLSRHQCTIKFGPTGWLLDDGDGDKKGSMNGTWLFVDEAYKLEDKAIFKAG